MEYYKNKLIRKIKIISKSKGIIRNLDIKDSLFYDIKPSKYEIIWDTESENIISLVEIKEKVNIFNGIYYFGSKTLYSSEFIEFTLEEEREFKLNKVLNIKNNPYFCKNKLNKMLTDSEKKKIQHKKELKSLKNRMSTPNFIWFNSLPINKQYDFLFEWKSEKNSNKIKTPKVRYIKKRKYYGGTKLKVVEYPANLKHFIMERKDFGKWIVDKSSIRNSSIDLLLNHKKK